MALAVPVAGAAPGKCAADVVPPDWDPNAVRAAPGAKALVTGGAGFIGSHVAQRCLELGFEVVVVDDLSGGFVENLPHGVQFVEGDIKDSQFVSTLMQQHRFHVVYHLAAYAAEALSHFIRSYNYQNNVVGSANLITQSVRCGTVKRFVFTSSIAVYGAAQTPFREDITPTPEDPYGIGKYAIELDLAAASRMFGLQFVVLRPHNVYGPGQNMQDTYRNVVGIFLNQLRAGKDLTVFGDGSQTRKFSYIDDVSTPIALCGLVPQAANQVFNVGARSAHTVNQLAEAVLASWGNPSSKRVHLRAREEVKHAESLHAKLDCFLPGLPEPTELTTGIQRTVEWAKQSEYHSPVVFEAVELKAKMPPSWVHPGLREVPCVNHTKHHKSTRLAEHQS